MVETHKIDDAVRLKEEGDLIKSVFKDNDYLLKVLRSLFYGIEVSKEDKALVKSTFKDITVREAFRKKFYSKFGDDCQIGNISDFWVQIPEEKIVGASQDTITQIIQPRKKLIEMLERSMSLLVDPDGVKVDLSYDPNNTDKLQLELLARNKYLNVISAGLNFIKLAANSQTETAEQIKDRLMKSSNK